MLKIGTRDIAALRMGEREIARAYLGETLVFGGGKSPSRLPEGYTEVEYIESSGEQYFDTGLKPSASTRLVMDIETMAEDAAIHYVFDSYVSVSNRWYMFRAMRTQLGAIRARMGYDASDIVVDDDTTPRRMLLDWDAKSRTAKVNEKSATFANSTFSASMPTIKLLASGSASTTSRISAKLYSCQMYAGTTQTRDFVPCIDPSGAVGLYDLVESKFYANAGTGAFTAGPAV